jgi:hypothetical protein
MSSVRLWSERSGRLTILFLAVVVPPAIALVWLGQQLLRQDVALEAQRAGERQQAAVQASALALERILTDAQRWLTEDPIPAGGMRLTISSQGIRVHPPDRLLWVPRPLTSPRRDA